jgi:hypothetical protein
MIGGSIPAMRGFPGIIRAPFPVLASQVAPHFFTYSFSLQSKDGLSTAVYMALAPNRFKDFWRG